MSEQYLISNGTVMTLGNDNRVIPDGAVMVSGSVIEAVGTRAELKGKFPGVPEKDARGMMILPGLVNAHMHLYSTFATGMGFEPAANFVDILKNLWWKLDRALVMDDVYYSSLIPLIKCIKAGTTTIIDHHASPAAIEGSLFRIADAVKEAGIRASLCYEVTDRGGEAEARAGIQENIDFNKACREHPDERLHGLFGLHASFTVGKETLAKSVEAATDLGTGLHVHVAEDKADVVDSREKYGCGVVERFAREGVLGPQTLAGHCIHISEAEQELLKESATNVAHNPQSNMNNAVGCADMLGMFRRGVLIGLGTDAMTCNMFQEAWTCNLIHHHVQADPRVAFCETVDLLTRHNPQIAGEYFRRPVGVLLPGAFADIILVDYKPWTPLGDNNFYGHFLFGMSSAAVDTTICHGKVLMENRRLLHLDEEAIAARSRELAAHTWERL